MMKYASSPRRMRLICYEYGSNIAVNPLALPRVLTPQESKGLSPLAQGNPTVATNSGGYRGSIPARAGEPSYTPPETLRQWVYLRSRRGTFGSYSPVGTWRGLSPLAQGNLQRSHRRAFGLGSIPARAGEPTPVRQCEPLPWVYPRSRRGTATACAMVSAE